MKFNQIYKLIKMNLVVNQLNDIFQDPFFESLVFIFNIFLTRREIVDSRECVGLVGQLIQECARNQVVPAFQENIIALCDFYYLYGKRHYFLEAFVQFEYFKNLEIFSFDQFILKVIVAHSDDFDFLNVGIGLIYKNDDHLRQYGIVIIKYLQKFINRKLSFEQFLNIFIVAIKKTECSQLNQVNIKNLFMENQVDNISQFCYIFNLIRNPEIKRHLLGCFGTINCKQNSAMAFKDVLQIQLSYFGVN